MPRIRLDQLVAERGLVPSREQARRLIMAGEVLVDGKVLDKPGTSVKDSAAVALKAKPRFVSRGGEKLEGALARFPIAVAGRVCADVGASTGGFTDCLLQRGAAKVYAIDVGRGQLDARLRDDERVVVMDETNARHLERLPEPVSFVAVDASFISLALVLPAVAGWGGGQGLPADVVALVKPQFEAGRKDVSRGAGVIRDPAIHARVLAEVADFAAKLGMALRGLMRSPITGPKGNVEFLAWLTPAADGPPPPDPATLIAAAVAPAAPSSA